MTTEAERLESTTTVFISYSRSEANLAHFVNDRLRDAGFDPWLDFKDLTPGESWDSQLAEAVALSDVVVMIFSRRSADSKNVKDEWKLARKHDKRVILLIFEAAPVPEELAECEWIDFRRGFGRATSKLVEVLRRPYERPAEPPPGSGFRAPLRVWLALLLSIGTAISSLAVAWTVFVPVALIPLPARILRRSFDYRQVRIALAVLPWAFYTTQAVVDPASFDLDSAWDSVFFVILLFSTALWLLMRGGSFRIWVKPAAARPLRTAINVEPYRDRTPRSRKYALDAAPQDEAYASRLDAALQAKGHVPADGADADVEFRFVSTYHDVLEVTPGRVTLPVLIADPDDELPRQLSRSQWIDARRGLTGTQLEAIGLLLDEPELLIGAIGVPPPHDQKTLPSRIEGFVLTLWISVAVVVGSGVLAFVALRGDLEALFSSGAFYVYLALGPVLAWVMLRTIRSLESRTPRRLRSAVVLAMSLGLFAVGAIAEEFGTLLPDDAPGRTAAESLVETPVFVAGVLVVMWAISIKQLRDWIPSRAFDVDERAGAATKATL